MDHLGKDKVHEERIRDEIMPDAFAPTPTANWLKCYNFFKIV